MPLKDTVVNDSHQRWVESSRRKSSGQGPEHLGLGLGTKVGTKRTGRQSPDAQHKTEATLARGGAQSRRAKAGHK